MADLTPPGEAPIPFAADEVERSIPDRLRELAHRCPDDPALSHDDVAPVSFAELWSSVEAAGRSLLTYGLDPGGVVAVLMPHETIAIATQ